MTMVDQEIRGFGIRFQPKNDPVQSEIPTQLSGPLVLEVVVSVC